MGEIKLPELPPADGWHHFRPWCFHEAVREYGRQCAKQAAELERERCARIAEDPKNGLSAWRTRETIAAAIRGTK